MIGLYYCYFFYISNNFFDGMKLLKKRGKLPSKGVYKKACLSNKKNYSFSDERGENINMEK